MAGGMWWGMGALYMGLFWVLVLVVAVVVVLAVARGRGRSGPREDSHKTARTILEERYARGEIGKEEFEEKKRDLQG
jgi:putative membrane protein